MRILFVGTAVPDDVEEREKNVSAAGNRFQGNVIRALLRAGHEVTVLSYLGMPLSEEGMDLLLQSDTITGKDQAHYVYKQSSLPAVCRHFKGALCELLEKTDLCMAYNVAYVYFTLPDLARAAHKKSLLFLADYSPAKSFKGLKAIPRKGYAAAMLCSIRRYDKVIGLSKNTGRLLRKKQEFTFLPGGLEEEMFSYLGEKDGQTGLAASQKSAEKTLVYSGLLSEVTGVDRLLRAFVQLQEEAGTRVPNLRLVLTGKGPLEQMVREYSKQYADIEYLGALPYEEYLLQIKQADYLINPRNMELPENQNNFPSKMMDYLASGNRILSTRFVGSEIFTDYVSFCGCEVEALKAGMVSLLNEEPHTAEEKEKQRDFARRFLWTEAIREILN